MPSRPQRLFALYMLLTSPPDRPSPPEQSDEVLGKVQSIIAEQLGTDVEKVRAPPAMIRPHRHCRIDASDLPRPPQVGPDAKFVDLGPDSLDTVGPSSLSTLSPLPGIPELRRGSNSLPFVYVRDDAGRD